MSGLYPDNRTIKLTEVNMLGFEEPDDCWLAFELRTVEGTIRMIPQCVVLYEHELKYAKKHHPNWQYRKLPFRPAGLYV